MSQVRNSLHISPKPLIVTSFSLAQIRCLSHLSSCPPPYPHPSSSLITLPSIAPFYSHISFTLLADHRLSYNPYPKEPLSPDPAFLPSHFPIQPLLFAINLLLKNVYLFFKNVTYPLKKTWKILRS